MPVVKVRYEGGVLKPLEPVELREGEEALVVIREDLVEFARRVRERLKGRRQGVEPGELLSRERDRFA